MVVAFALAPIVFGIFAGTLLASMTTVFQVASATLIADISTAA